MSAICFPKCFSLTGEGSQLETPVPFLRKSDFELGEEETDFQDIIPYTIT